MSGESSGAPTCTAPFVIVVASEKGGVGKTTIATNLAVYLKALREDLPVTIASFDNHFSVDAMFAIGGRAGGSVAALFQGSILGEQVQLGEYGVQFLASERDLTPSCMDTSDLCRALAVADLPGILILDTRPILDHLTRCALGAADLVLAPVKDRASLVNIASLQQALIEEGGNSDRLWVLPSVIDARLKLGENVGLHEFIDFSARERGYHVTPAAISKSPKVEGLATSFSRRVYPVLSHARTTVVHQQFRQLASFLLEHYDQSRVPHSRQLHLREVTRSMPAARRKRLNWNCPLCREAGESQDLWFWEDTIRRRQGFVHLSCLAQAGLSDLAADAEKEGLWALVKPEPGWNDDQDLHLCRFSGSDQENHDASPQLLSDAMYDLVRGISGRLPEELPAAALIFAAGFPDPTRYLERDGYRNFAGKRKEILKQIRSRYGF